MPYMKSSVFKHCETRTKITLVSWLFQGKQEDTIEETEGVDCS